MPICATTREAILFVVVVKPLTQVTGLTDVEDAVGKAPSRLLGCEGEGIYAARRFEFSAVGKNIERIFFA